MQWANLAHLGCELAPVFWRLNVLLRDLQNVIKLKVLLITSPLGFMLDTILVKARLLM